MKCKKNKFWIYSKFGMKLYINYGSVLRAARLKKVDFYLGSDEYICTYEVAGLGVVSEELDTSGTHYYAKRIKVFESVESFKEGKSLSMDKYGRSYTESVFRGIIINTVDILTEAFKDIAEVKFIEKDYCYELVRYKWNGVSAEEVSISGNVWMDADGCHTDAKIPDGTFFSKEECEKANQISVIEFEDEE